MYGYHTKYVNHICYNVGHKVRLKECTLYGKCHV